MYVNDHINNSTVKLTCMHRVVFSRDCLSPGGFNKPVSKKKCSSDILAICSIDCPIENTLGFFTSFIALSLVKD